VVIEPLSEKIRRYIKKLFWCFYWRFK
jgi:hypothetical protein